MRVVGSASSDSVLSADSRSFATSTLIAHRVAMLVVIMAMALVSPSATTPAAANWMSSWFTELSLLCGLFLAIRVYHRECSSFAAPAAQVGFGAGVLFIHSSHKRGSLACQG